MAGMQGRQSTYSGYRSQYGQEDPQYAQHGAIGVAQPLAFAQPLGYEQSAAILNRGNAYGEPSGYAEQYQQRAVSQIEPEYDHNNLSYRQSQYPQPQQPTYAGYNNGYRQSQYAARQSTYAEERNIGYGQSPEYMEQYPHQAGYDDSHSDGYHGSDRYTESDTKEKSETGEDMYDAEPDHADRPVVAMPRPQRHPHYYVPPVLRFYTLLTAFLIAAGLVGLTEIGMRRLPHAAKSEHINPTDLSNALASQADHDSSSGILKRAPQTLIATPVSSLKPSVTVSVSTPSVISSASQPPQTTVGTVVSASNVPTTQPSVVTATPSSSGSASASSGLDSSLQTGLTLTSKVSTTHVTSVSSNLVTTNSNGQQTTIVTLVASTSTGVTAVETTVSTGKSTSENKKSIFTPLDTFVGNSYMVLVIAVVFKQFWSAIYGQAKLMEPFTMMNTEDGAPANRVMNLFYLSSSILPDAITAVMNGRWFILWNALVFMSVCALAPLGSEMLFLNTKYLECSAITDNINNPCWPPRLTIDPVIARAVQGLLTFIAMMTLTVMFLVNRMRTGIYADPSSIAAIAALTHHPEVLADFRALSDEATSKDIAEFISSKKYKLDDYMRPNGTWRFGIVPVNPTGQAGYRSVDAKRSAFDARPKSRRWKLWDTIFDVMFLFLLLALLGIVAGYYSTSGNDAYNRFFSTMTFGPRFVLTGTGTLIAVNWRRLERDSHTLSPFRRMAQTPSEPLSTILLRKSSIPLTAVLPMFFKGYYIASFIAFVAVVSEVLVIILGAVPYAPGQVYVELLVSAYMSMSLLGLMIIALITLMFWKHNLPDLPRAPDTVASMVTYVAESKMQEDFETAEWCDDRELSGRIVALGKRYVYGKQAGSDGEYRHLVDEEPTLVY